MKTWQKWLAGALVALGGAAGTVGQVIGGNTGAIWADVAKLVVTLGAGIGVVTVHHAIASKPAPTGKDQPSK